MSAPPTIRIGLAGLGRIGTVHADILRTIDEIDSLVLADRDPSRARDHAARLGAVAVDSPAGLFSAGIDGLVIAAATAAHADLIVAGVRAGVPVFCEKPVAPDAAATLALVRDVAGAPAPPSPAYITSSGGFFRDCSVHDFDAIRWSRDVKVREVYAAGYDVRLEVLGSKNGIAVGLDGGLPVRSA